MMNERPPGMFIDNSEDEICQLCEKKIQSKDYPGIIAKALARKYCTNLNQFFYVKDVNKAIANNRYFSTNKQV
jgi:disulfide oxidoreductase YuzD